MKNQLWTPSHVVSGGFKHERRDAWLIFTGQYVTALTPGYTLRARDGEGKGWRGGG